MSAPLPIVAESSPYATVTVYRTATGAILRVCSVPREDAALQAQAGEGWIEAAANPATQYVDVSASPPALATRAALPAPSKTSIVADGVDAATWAGLPNPTSVRVDGALVGTVTDGAFAFASDDPGTYVVDLDAGAAYLPQRTLINAA